MAGVSVTVFSFILVVPVELIIECLNPPRTITLLLGRDGNLTVTHQGNTVSSGLVGELPNAGVSYNNRPKITSTPTKIEMGKKFDLADLIKDPEKYPDYAAMEGLEIWHMYLKGKNSKNRSVLKEIEVKGGAENFVYKKASMDSVAGLFGLGNPNKLREQHDKVVGDFIKFLRELTAEKVLDEDWANYVINKLEGEHEANSRYSKLLITLGLPGKPVVAIDLTEGGESYSIWGYSDKAGKPEKGESEYIYQAVRSGHRRGFGELPRNTALTVGLQLGSALELSGVHAVVDKNRSKTYPPAEADKSYLAGARVLGLELRTHRGETDKVKSYILGGEYSPRERKSDGTGPEEVESRNRYASLLDSIANKLEVAGLKKLAAELDIVANTLEKQ